LKTEIAKLIRDERIKQGLSIRSLADKADLHHPQIVRLEQGKGDLTTFEKTLAVLGYKLQVIKTNEESSEK
jgi:transcriptional regulator with XRE-family HTH domain